MENQETDNSSKYNIPLVILIAIGAVLALIIPFHYQSTSLESTSFNTVNEKSNSLELGDTQVTKVGSKGQDNVTYDSWGSIFQRLFSPDEVSKSEVSRTTVTAPVDEVATHGTRKSQYMYCSDGSYRYFTDEQFKDPNTGFTSKSPDACAQNGQGKEYMLSDSPPVALPQIQSLSGGAICSDGWRSYSTGRGTCSHHGGVSYWL